MVEREASEALGRTVTFGSFEVRWADPLRYWAAALARRSDYRAAERRYRMAAERAPRWGALHVAWAQTLWRLGRRDEALSKLRAAAAMALGAADRARLAAITARAEGRRM